VFAVVVVSGIETELPNVSLTVELASSGVLVATPENCSTVPCLNWKLVLVQCSVIVPEPEVSAVAIMP
jgi:hypothetical protein